MRLEQEEEGEGSVEDKDVHSILGLASLVATLRRGSVGNIVVSPNNNDTE